MGEREIRVAHIEALFRDVNERIAESAKHLSASEAEFVCECADSECVERVPATLAAYEDVRSDGTHFLLVPGHEDTRIERVVQKPHRRFAVVEKFNAVVVWTVRRLDPRTQPA